MPLTSRAGMTMMEVLIASAISVLVVVGITSLDITRSRLQEDTRRQSGLLTPEHGRVALAVIHLVKHLERADVVAITGALGDNVLQIREPAVGGCVVVDAACIDNPANYRWSEYSLTAGTLQFYDNTGAGCGAVTPLAGQVTGLTIQFQDASGPPPGGEPAVSDPADNNMVAFSIGWSDPATGRSHDFTGQVAIRASPYSDVTSGMSTSAPGTPGSC